VNVYPALAIILASSSPVFAAQWAKTFTLVGPPELRLQAEDATIQIVGEDRVDIDARVTTAGWKISDHDVRVVDKLSGNVLDLQVVTPQLNYSFARRSVKVELRVPRGINCEVKGGMHTITVTGVKGNAVLVSKAGVINAIDLDGKLDATTGEGRIRARGRFDVLTMHSGYGAIDVEATARSRMFSAWRITTDDGNITLHVPAGFAADLDLEIDAGHIAVDLPYTIAGSPDQSRVQGKMNGGGEALVLRTSGGNIKVSKK
jgi:DUF4097 and DUF4098 domain-containing protein YvlB